jgi:hypothetical protein
MNDIEYKVHLAKLITINSLKKNNNKIKKSKPVLLNFEFVMEIVYDILIALLIHHEIFVKIIKFHP